MVMTEKVRPVTDINKLVYKKLFSFYCCFCFCFCFIFFFFVSVCFFGFCFVKIVCLFVSFLILHGCLFKGNHLFFHEAPGLECAEKFDCSESRGATFSRSVVRAGR